MAETENPHLMGPLLAPEISEMLVNRQTREARAALLDLLDPEIADILETLEPRLRAIGFRLLPRARAADVFTYLPLEQQEELVSELSSEQVARLMEEMAPDDRASLFDELPGQVAAKVLSLLNPDARHETQAILGYPAESVGRIMTPDYIALHPDWTVQQSLEHIRKHGRDAETFDVVYVVDEQGKLLDEILLRQLLLVDPLRTVRSVMQEQVVSLNAHEDREAAVLLMQKFDRPALPVMDRAGVLVGIVTFDDVADVAEVEATEDIHKMGGMEALEDPYTTVPLWQLVRKRGPWLTVLFFGQMLTATAMAGFEDEIATATVLALFVPLIISSGGNSGSQAATLIIRSMAVGELAMRDWLRVFRREVACGLLLGLLLGGLGLLRIGVWHWLGWADYTSHYYLLAVVVGVSLLGVVLWGTIIGSMLPFLLRLARLDPATVSAPMVGTLVDVTGVVIYFSSAWLLLRGTLL